MGNDTAKPTPSVSEAAAALRGMSYNTFREHASRGRRQLTTRRRDWCAWRICEDAAAERRRVALAGRSAEAAARDRIGATVGGVNELYDNGYRRLGVLTDLELHGVYTAFDSALLF